MATLKLTLEEARKPQRLKIGEPHVVRILRARRVRLVGMFFEHAKSFLLPSAFPGIREVKTQFDRHPRGSLLMVGHTDASGDPEGNFGLSLERAEAVCAFLTDDVAAWESRFQRDRGYALKWGTREVQWMLSALERRGASYYIGEPNGREDGHHDEAVRAFQEDESLEVDGIAGPDTRKALIRRYMAQDGTTLPAGMRIAAHGCGEDFPFDHTPDGTRDPDNRRVEAFLFEGDVEPPQPADRRSRKGSAEYPRWLAQVGATIDLGLGEADPAARLASRYALERFEAFADALPEGDFVAWASIRFGTDIPEDAYRTLHRDLKGRALEAPEIQLVPGGIAGRDSAYDNATRMIGVRAEIALAAEEDDEAAGKLLALLMHEFGHHVDDLLRERYSRVGGDAEDDEAGHFAFSLAGMHHVDTDTIRFATLTRDGKDTPLALSFPEYHEAVRRYLADPEHQEEIKGANIEFFGAGRGNPNFPHLSFGHQSIEDGLGTVDPGFFSPEMREQVYFGNWLRDFSQVIDPGWLQIFENPFLKRGPALRAFVTEIVDTWARDEFDPKSTPSQHAAGVFRVTTGKLGVYRPEEHMDNPDGLTDGRAYDPDFHGPVSPAQVAVNPRTGCLKGYIADRLDPTFLSSADFISASLVRAVAEKPTPEGRRFFGQALHTLEDLYAHSNFVELALISLGHASVYPWVGEKARFDAVDPAGKVVEKGRIPMVTGSFGKLDTGVSLLYSVAEKLEKGIEVKDGRFTGASVLSLKLLQSLDPRVAKAVEALAIDLEGRIRYKQYFDTLLRSVDGALDYLKRKIAARIRGEMGRITQLEEKFLNDPSSTDPTHSMLAKDHDDHALHAIAARCAAFAVRTAGAAMRDAWLGLRKPEDVVREVLAFLVHPNDIQVRPPLAASPQLELLKLIKDFADANPAVIAGLDKTSSVARFRAHAKAERQKTLEEARVLYARNETAADRISDAMAVA